MNEDERFARNNAYTSSIMLFSKLCAAHAVYEHNFGDLRTASVAHHTLFCATAFFIFFCSHKSVHSRRFMLTYFSWCASPAQPVVKNFFQCQYSAFDTTALLESDHFVEQIIVKRLHKLNKINVPT